MIRYTDSVHGITAQMLHGFFEGWKRPLSPADHLSILENSDHMVIAIESESGKIVGFVTALTDGVQAAFIPLLEVLPAYRSKGIGTALMSKLLKKLQEIPAIDLICNPSLQPFYARLGMIPSVGMVIRNYIVADRRSKKRSTADKRPNPR